MRVEDRLRASMAPLRTSIFLCLLLVSACRETFFYNSDDYKVDDSGRKFEISEEEARTIWENLKRRIDAGENLDGTTRVLLKIAQSKLSADNPLKPFTLSDARRAALQQKVTTYRGLAPTALNTYGFVDGCDGLLFTSLLRASGYETNLYQAETKTAPGKWHRNAAQDCLRTGESASTISRDMILGLSVALWQVGDRDSAEEILAYAAANQGYMGEAISQDERVSRTLMTPQLSGLLYEISYRLGGPDSDLRGYIPDFTSSLTGFEAHLQALRVMLRGALYKGLVSDDVRIMAAQLAKNPNNALFEAVHAAFTDGDMNAAADVLLTEKYFPAARLPRSSDRCEMYLWQRDEGTSDWLPCPNEGETHPGVDFLFVAQYVLGNFRTSER